MVLIPRILSIAGSDSGGGAGIQADVKTVTALGGYGATAITAITAQNTLGVQAVHALPPEIVAQQIESVLSDIGADAIKIGMVHSAPVIEAIAGVLASYPGIPIVLDPVMVAKGGSRLIDEEALSVLKRDLFVMSYLATPNVPEAEILTGMKIDTVDDAKQAAMTLATLGPETVLVKGGHLKTRSVYDVLYDGEEIQIFESKRLTGPNTHGTGCTLSSAIATYLAAGEDLSRAVEQSIEYVQTAMRLGPAVGAGHRPLDHGHAIDG